MHPDPLALVTLARPTGKAVTNLPDGGGLTEATAMWWPRSVTRRVIMVAGAAAVVLVGAVLVTTRVQRAERGAISDDTIVMLGDSITAEGDWDALLPQWPIVNRGHSGHTTAQLLSEAEAIASHQPRAVFVLTGTNDIRDKHPPSWTVDRLGQILDRLSRGAPDSIVVLQTILPRADRAMPYGRPTLRFGD